MRETGIMQVTAAATVTYNKHEKGGKHEEGGYDDDKQSGE